MNNKANYIPWNWTETAVPAKNGYNYSTFGTLMGGSRGLNQGDTRYGFNSMESDDEIKGNGNSYNTDYRQYDPRLGRWTAVEPKSKKFPSWSPYVFSFDNPLSLNDPKGDSPPTLQELYQKLSGSKTFLALATKANINEKNLETWVSYVEPGDPRGTSTDNFSGAITFVKRDDINDLSRSFAHEITNRKNLKKIQEADVKVKWGDVSPSEYAELLLSIEIEAAVNQVIVLSEIDVKIEGEEYLNSIIDQYKSGKLKKSDLEALIKEDVKNATGENGQSLKEQYKEQGENLKASGEQAKRNVRNDPKKIKLLKERDVKSRKEAYKTAGVKT